jgi:peptidyl-prolyl cis-trans isomerase B (cyclophilin B)
MKKIILLFTAFFIVFATGCTSKQENKVEPTPEVKEEVDVAPVQKVEIEKGPNDKNPLVTIEMEDGSIIKVELYPEIAPNTVRNFVSLINSKFYDGLIFHRVMPGFMIQGGDPEGTGIGGPGYTIAGEFSENGFNNELKHDKGVISMARGGNSMDSAGSQFFIVVADSARNSASLDAKYASFGKVTEGIEIAEKIVNTPRDEDQDSPTANRPKKDQKMKKVTVDTFGVKYGEVEKVK